MSTCNKAGQTRVNTPLFGCKTRLKQFEHGATRGEFHAPRSDQSASGIYCPTSLTPRALTLPSPPTTHALE
ncbi:hypothetical protein CgunFtcFv8_022492 [Champsocephalus gunnari]|uniref:Uncharacterized protein n=1 Tax=Champsocephalus gunnari TaxID=52237 RepID=A0AAN8DRC1_CHAGU|nr:hypothetical protein CgunFtcFv8_022492 [Champsocephalus gunnari]